MKRGQEGGERRGGRRGGRGGGRGREEGARSHPGVRAESASTSVLPCPGPGPAAPSSPPSLPAPCTWATWERKVRTQGSTPTPPLGSSRGHSAPGLGAPHSPPACAGCTSCCEVARPPARPQVPSQWSWPRSPLQQPPLACPGPALTWTAVCYRGLGPTRAAWSSDSPSYSSRTSLGSAHHTA